MNILITGATAYAGFHAAIALRDAGHKVTALVRDPRKPRARALLQQEIQLLQGDIKTPESYREALRDCDVMIHAMMDGSDPQGADLALFDALQEVSVTSPADRLFVYTTGCSIYGKVPQRLMDERTPVNPQHPLAFRAEMENRLFALDAPGLRRVVVRPGFIYGKDALTSTLARWFAEGEAAAKSGEPVEFRGDREKGWSWVHVSDLAAAYLKVAEHPALDGEIFCLANEQQPRSVDAMRACLAAAGFHGDISFGPLDPNNPMDSWGDQNEFISSAKARRILGWQARHAGVIDDAPTLFAAWKAAQSG